MAEGVFVRMLRGTLSPSLSGEKLKRELVPILLALRQVSSYLAFKIGSQVAANVFKSFHHWHYHFPKGQEDTNFQTFMAGSLGPIGEMKESEQLAVASLTLLFDGSADAILLKQLTLDPNASAESLVQLPGLSQQDILTFESIMSAWHSENPVVKAVEEKDQQEKLEQTPVKEDADLPKEEPKETMQEPAACSEKPEPEMEENAEVKSRALELWPHLCVAEATQDSLLTLPQQTQDLINTQAQTRTMTLS